MDQIRLERGRRALRDAENPIKTPGGDPPGVCNYFIRLDQRAARTAGLLDSSFA
jgi:hypothetical protein